MAAQHHCVLLASDYEDKEEFAILVSALVYCKRTWNYPVRCSLAKSAIEVALSANQVEKLDCRLDTNCDPLMGEGSIYENRIISADEAEAVSQGANFQLSQFDLANYPNLETNCAGRLYQLLVNEIVGSAVILTPFKCVAACFGVLGQNPANVPVISQWVIDTEPPTATILWQQETKDDLKAALQQENCFLEVPPEPVIPTRKPPEAGENPPPMVHPPLNDAVRRIATQLFEEIRPTAEGEIPPTDDPTQQLLLAVTYALRASRDEVIHLTTLLEDERKAAEERVNTLGEECKKMRTELQQVKDQLQIKEGQREKQAEMLQGVDQRLQDTRGLAERVIQEMQEANQSVKKLRDEVQQLRTEALAPQPVVQSGDMSHLQQEGNGLRDGMEKPDGNRQQNPSSSPLSIASIERRPEGNLMVSIRKNWEGVCEGYMSILKNGECLQYSPSVIVFTGVNEIDISEWARLEPGNYELVVTNSQWESFLSEKSSFTIPHEMTFPPAFTVPSEVAFSPAFGPDPYQNSFVYANLQNLAECEVYVMNEMGEAALRMFKHLVAEWKNPAMDQMFPFVQAVMGVLNLDEETAKTTLLSQGFQL